MSKFHEFKLSNNKLEDLYSVYKIGYEIAKKRHKDSPNLLKSIETLKKRFERKLRFKVNTTRDNK